MNEFVGMITPLTQSDPAETDLTGLGSIRLELLFILQVEVRSRFHFNLG